MITGKRQTFRPSSVDAHQSKFQWQQASTPLDGNSWVYTIGVIALSVWAVLSNPNMLFGESESAIGLALVELPIYPGQVTALQLLGTFAIALGLLSRMNERQHINRVSVSAIGGALLIMAGLLLQQLQENPLLLVGLIGMAFYIILIWGIAAAAQAAYLLWQKAKQHRRP